MTLRDIAADAAKTLLHAGLDAETARRDATTLARHVLNWDAAQWLAGNDAPGPTGFTDAFSSLIKRRARREPLAYIVGSREFYGRSFVVTPDVLIPRPETELVVDAVLALARDRAGLRILDIGTGSGCLAVTVALELPGARVTATDNSEAALAIARENAKRLEASDRIDWRTGDLVAGSGATFDIIMSNPPYVPEPDRAAIAPEVRDYEPTPALFAGPDGLDVIRRLLPAAAGALSPDSWLVFEIGDGQSRSVEHIVAQTPRLRLVRFVSDLQSIPRVAVTRRDG